MKKKRQGIAVKSGLVAAAAVAGIVTGSYFIPSPGTGASSDLPAYTVARVIDGDTFETTDNLRIRLALSDAPELSRCGGPEAKKALEQLIGGKPVYVRVTLVDGYRRLLGMVYTKNIFVNEEMLRRGYSYYPSSNPQFKDVLRPAIEEARAKKLGIHGPTCTQRENTEKPSCTVKANISTRGKIYYTPDCGIYDRVDVQLYQGDQWFCTKEEAEKAGFRPPVQCP